MERLEDNLLFVERDAYACVLYGEGDAGEFTPTVRNINMENVTCNKSKYALSISGYERSPITNVNLKNCTFNNVEKKNVLVGIEGLNLENVRINREVQK